MYKVKINKKEYRLVEGFSITKELGETLDSGVISIYSDLLADIQPFDEVYIDNKKMLVDTFTSEIVDYWEVVKGQAVEVASGVFRFMVNGSYISVKKGVCYQDEITHKNYIYYRPHLLTETKDFIVGTHQYQINLFSETKALERYTLPNLAISKRTPARSVWYYLDNYCNCYLNGVRTLNDSLTGLSIKPRFSLDPILQEKFSDIDCPEFQWNNPTLREVLNDLMMTKDCIPVVKDNQISFLDLSQKQNQIDASKLSNMQTTMSSNDYVGELTCVMKNAISEEIVKTGWTTLRNETDRIIQTSNCYLILSKPIYGIKSLKVKFDYSYKDKDNVTHQATMTRDITSHITEADNYKTLNPNATDHPTDYDPDTFGTDYQQFMLYYTRGSNKIEGITPFTYVVERYSIDWICRLYADKSTGVWQMDGIRNFGFQVEYYTNDSNAVISVGKYLPTNRNTNNRVFDNQSSSFVDSKRQSIFEYLKVNRLGNKVLTIFGEYDDESEIPTVGDYINDHILFSSTVSYYDNKLYFKGLIAEHYILKNYFTSVKAQIRSWKIADAGDAFTRNDLYKYFIEFGDTYLDDTDLLSYMGIKYPYTERFVFEQLANNIKEFNYPANNQMTLLTTKAVNSNERYPSKEGGQFAHYQLDSFFENRGRSLISSCGFTDNYSAGAYVFVEGLDYKGGFYKYADNNGEATDICIDFFNQNKRGSGFVGDSNYKYPYVPTSEVYIFNELHTIRNTKIVKDQREILAATVQLEACSRNDKILIGSGYMASSPFLEHPNQARLEFRGNQHEININGEVDSTDSVVLPVRLKMTQYRLSYKYELVDDADQPFDFSSYKSWSLHFIEGNKDLLIIGSNDKINAWYINRLGDRDINVYDNIVERNVIGTIADDIETLKENYLLLHPVE